MWNSSSWCDGQGWNVLISLSLRSVTTDHVDEPIKGWPLAPEKSTNNTVGWPAKDWQLFLQQASHGFIYGTKSQSQTRTPLLFQLHELGIKEKSELYAAREMWILYALHCRHSWTRDSIFWRWKHFWIYKRELVVINGNDSEKIYQYDLCVESARKLQPFLKMSSLL